MSSPKGIRAGKAYVELGVSDKLAAGLKRAQKRLEAFGAGVRSVGTRLAALGGAALAPLFGAAKTFADVGDRLDEMSARTGVSTEALSELGFAADLAGADAETLEAGLRRMQKTLAEAASGSESANDALSKLGLSVADLQNLSPEQQFKLIGDRLSRIKDPALRTAGALEVLGKSGTKLLPMFADGAAGLEQMQQQARDLGLTISGETAKDAARLADALDIVWKVLKQGVFIIGSALAPTITGVANAVTRVVVRVTDWIRQNKALVVTALKVAAAVAATGLGLIALGWAISGVAAALGGIASIVGGVGVALKIIVAAVAAIISPMGLVISAAVALGAVLLVTTEAGADALAWLSDRFQALKDVVFKVIGGISDALAAGDIGLAANILWLSLKLAWQEGVAALNRVWLEAKRFFLSAVQTMFYGALALSQQVLHGLEVAWIETTAFLSKIWTNFIAGFQKAWNGAINWTTKRLLDLQGVFDDSLDVDAAKKMADDDLADTNAEIDRQRERALKARENQRQRERDSSSELNDATLAEIGKQFDDAQQTLATETNAKIAATKQALAGARQELDQALATARSKRDALDAQPGAPRRTLGDPLAELDERISGLGDLVSKKLSVTGTFNPAAIQGLGGDAAERTAKATSQTATHTKRILDAVKAGGLTFM